MIAECSRSGHTRIVLATTVALLMLLVMINPTAAQDFGKPESGQRVYDRAGLLTEEDLAMLEQRAAAVEEAGAPVIVFLQAEEADFDETLEDGRELMESWDVRSEPGSRDGVVIFLNLEPDDLRHGQLALVAGETHFDGGNLPQYELDRITSEMRTILEDEETALGIPTGLEMISASLTNGPPPPPEPGQLEQTASDLSRGPFSLTNIVSTLIAGALAVFSVRVWRSRPITTTQAISTSMPPDDLIPAAAGALASGRINDMQMEATILDLARRGALAIESEDEKKTVQLRLRDSSAVKNDVEQQVWNALKTETQDDGLVTSKKLSKVRSHWGPAKGALKSGLESRGWYDPDAGRRRLPLYLAGTAALLLALVVFVISIAGEQSWGLLGAGILTTLGIIALSAGYEIPDTTLEGESRAQPWRGYLKGLKDLKGDENVEVDLDQAVPYAIAMNARTALDKRLKKASGADYSPLWLGGKPAQDTWGTIGFYPYWVSFHAGVSPAAGAGTGGAAAGSGGSGGGF